MSAALPPAPICCWQRHVGDHRQAVHQNRPRHGSQHSFGPFALRATGTTIIPSPCTATARSVTVQLGLSGPPTSRCAAMSICCPGPPKLAVGCCVSVRPVELAETAVVDAWDWGGDFSGADAGHGRPRWQTSPTSSGGAVCGHHTATPRTRAAAAHRHDPVARRLASRQSTILW